jgi:hypothetical protein
MTIDAARVRDLLAKITSLWRPLTDEHLSPPGAKLGGRN